MIVTKRPYCPRGVVGVTDDPLVGLNTPELNFTTRPAVSVPLGLDRAGVPFGVQVVAGGYDPFPQAPSSSSPSST